MKNKLTIVFLFSILCSCSDLFDNSIIEPIITPQVIFNANGGTGTMSNQSFTVGEPQELSVNIFTRAGYTFTGWNTQADGSGTSYGDKQSVTFSTETPLILYAQWEKNVTVIYTEVIFNANGGTGTMSNQSFIVGEPQELSVNIFTRAGYTFTCWNTQADGSGTSYGDKQSVTFSTETPLILYAQWKKNVTYFLVPDIDKLKLYDDSNNCTENNLIEDVTLKECFDQVADDKGNLYFSCKKEDKIIIAKYDGENVSEITKKAGSHVRLSYDDSDLFVLIDNAIYIVNEGELKEIYRATERINGFTADNGYIYVSDKDSSDINKIAISDKSKTLYCSVNCDKHNSFISDMTIVNGDLYLLQVECADFSYFYGSGYWRGALIKVNSDEVKKIALSPSDFGTEETFYSPLRFLAKRKDELLIMDDGVVAENGEIKQKNRLAIFNFADETVMFSDMTEQLLYNFNGSF